MTTPVWNDFGFAWLAMPVWTSVAIEDPPAPPDEPTPSADPAPCDESPLAREALSDATADRGPRAAGGESPRKPEAIRFRLTFQGYAWHPQAQWAPFANPSWDRFVESPEDVQALQLQQEREQRKPPSAPRRADKPRTEPGAA